MRKIIEVKVENQHKVGFTKIKGMVDGYDVICFSDGLFNYAGTERWIISSSTSLPSNIDEAKRYVVAMNMAIQKLEEIKQERK